MIMGLSERIRTLRQGKDISQAKLAEYLGLTKGAVNSWECNATQPTLIYVIRLANFFNVSTDYLLGLNNKNMVCVDGLTNKQINTINDLISDIRQK
jgi:transcriptional regulator with XRE-family HTH domain